MICRAKLFRLAWSTARSMSLFNKTSPRREFAYALKLAWRELKKRAGLEAMYARQMAEKVAADRAALLEARAHRQGQQRAEPPAQRRGGPCRAPLRLQDVRRRLWLREIHRLPLIGRRSRSPPPRSA